MRLTAALTEYRYALDLTPKSQKWYAQKLDTFAAYCAANGIADVEGITAPLVRRFLTQLRENPSPRYGRDITSHTLHGYARAVKAFLNWAVREDLLNANVPARVEMPRRASKVLAIFEPTHIERLLRACDASETPEYVARDRAIVALLLDTGMRANELCTLTLANVHFTPDDAYVLLEGKGRKQREVPLGRTARRLLHGYLHRQRPRTREVRVFLAKGGTPLTPEGLDRLLYRLRDRADIEGVRCSAHTFRHTYAVRSLEAGVDLYKLSRLMGHSSVVITEGYLRAFSARAARQGGVSVLDSLR
jgi:site-specific recombinase XerD